MNSSLRKTVCVLALTLPCLLYFSLLDDDVSPDTRSLLALTETVEDSAAYFYLLGIQAPEDLDPGEEGTRIFERHTPLDIDGSDKLQEINDDLQSPKGTLFCTVFQQECLENLFATEFDIELLRREHATLISRSEIFHSFGEYRTLAKPSINEVFPQYDYLTAAERIAVLGAISDYRKGQIESAVDTLFGQTIRLRRAMELQDNLLGKLIFLARLGEVIDVASIMLTSTPSITTDKIPYLTPGERSFREIAAREFALSYEVMNETLFPTQRHTGDAIVRAVMRLFYKPNMTANAIAKLHKRMEKMAQLSHVEFAHTVESEVSVIPKTPLIRNALGNFLLEESPDYSKYVARFYDFDVKVALFNHRFHSRSELSTAKNLYYPDTTTFALEDRVCFHGPIEDERSQCLRTGINPRFTQINP